MTKVLFYVCSGMAAAYFVACIYLSRHALPTWQAAAMGAFFLGLAYIHHRRLR